MRLKFLKDVNYVQNKPEDCREYKAGETYEVSADHGSRWIRRQVAVEVVPEAKATKTEPKADAKQDTKAGETSSK